METVKPEVTNDEDVKSEVAGVVEPVVQVGVLGLPVTSGEVVSSHRAFMDSVRQFLDGLKSSE